MSYVGRWFARFRDDIAITSAHFCESEIADRKVTHCGRQMGELEGTELREASGIVVVTCQRCYLGMAVSPERLERYVG